MFMQSAWCRRLTDGRTMIMVITDKPILPDGVNDAVARVSVEVGDIRDETEYGKGKTYMDILESGWNAMPKPKNVTLAEAIGMIG